MTRSISPRRYDATERRRLAEQQRRDSRRRVVAAATQRFLQAGYAATTIADVARAAGVAVQTVYSAVGGKAGLLIAVVNQAVAGDDRDVMFLEREWMTALRAEPDPHRQVRIFADTMTAIGARVVPLYVMMRAAAAGDPDVAAAWQRSVDLRRESARAVVAALRGRRPDVSQERAIDLVWMLASPEVYEMLVLQRGWAPAECADWVAGSISAAVLDRPGQRQEPKPHRARAQPTGQEPNPTG
ncbi:MAG TPA: helix-turn-helix domain-containing protein [Streptosporangiaceae bacterium]